MPRLSVICWVTVAYGGLLASSSIIAGCSESQSEAEASFHRELTKAHIGDSDTIEVYDQLVGDRDLDRLAKLSELRRLVLDQTTITDDGMPSLVGLSNLEHLRLRGSSQTRTS